MKHGTPNFHRAAAAGLALALFGFAAAPARADPSDPPPPESANDPEAPQTQSADPAPRKLPFLGEEAKKAGYELPLPFGGALILTRLTGREIEVTDVRVGVEGDPASVSQFVDLGTTSDIFNANLKFDVFVLPFLDVYALVGYVHNESITDAVVTLPRPGPIPGETVERTELNTELDGFLGGGGIVLAGGWRNFYAVADASYVKTDLGFDDAFTALIATVRFGYTGRVGKLAAQMWVGFGNWDTAATASGHGLLEDGRVLDFEADQQPETPWMYDLGANIEFSKTFQLVVDLGHDFHGGWLFVLGPTYRF